MAETFVRLTTCILRAVEVNSDKYHDFAFECLQELRKCCKKELEDPNSVKKLHTTANTRYFIMDYVVSYSKHYKLLQELLKYPAFDFTYVAKNTNISAFGLAVRYCKITAIKTLLEARALDKIFFPTGEVFLDTKLDEGIYQALYLFVEGKSKEHKKILKLLVEYVKDKYPWIIEMMLYRAVIAYKKGFDFFEERFIKIAKFLHKVPNRYNQLATKQGYYFLRAVADNINIATAKYILKHGANPNLSKVKGGTVVNLLIKKAKAYSLQNIYESSSYLISSDLVDANNYDIPTQILLLFLKNNPDVDFAINRDRIFLLMKKYHHGWSQQAKDFAKQRNIDLNKIVDNNRIFIEESCKNDSTDVIAQKISKSGNNNIRKKKPSANLKTKGPCLNVRDTKLDIKNMNYWTLKNNLKRNYLDFIFVEEDDGYKTINDLIINSCYDKVELLFDFSENYPDFQDVVLSKTAKNFPFCRFLRLLTKAKKSGYDFNRLDWGLYVCRTRDQYRKEYLTVIMQCGFNPNSQLSYPNYNIIQEIIGYNFDKDDDYKSAQLMLIIIKFSQYKLDFAVLDQVGNDYLTLAMKTSVKVFELLLVANDYKLTEQVKDYILNNPDKIKLVSGEKLAKLYFTAQLEPLIYSRLESMEIEFYYELKNLQKQAYASILAARQDFSKGIALKIMRFTYKSFGSLDNFKQGKHKEKNKKGFFSKNKYKLFHRKL